MRVRHLVLGRLLMFVIVGLLIVGCSGKSAPTTTPTAEPSLTPKQTPPEPQKADTLDDIASAKPDFVLTPKEVFDEFKKDPSAFAKKSEGKVFEVKGKVDTYDYDSSGDGKGGLLVDFEGFKCTDLHPMFKAIPGQTVTLRGRGAQFAGIFRWTIVKVEGDGPIEVSAGQLAKELAADESSASKKYNGKYLIVTGKVQKIEKGDVYLTPEGGEKPIVCLTGSETLKIANANGWLKEGEMSRLLGGYRNGQLTQAVVMPPKKT